MQKSKRGGVRAGAGRVALDPSGAKKGLSVSLSPAALADLEALVQHFGSSRSDIVARAIHDLAARVYAAKS